MSDQIPDGNSMMSPFETFHVPLTDVVTQSVEEMMANSLSPTPAVEAVAVAEVVAEPATEQVSDEIETVVSEPAMSEVIEQPVQHEEVAELEEIAAVVPDITEHVTIAPEAVEPEAVEPEAVEPEAVTPEMVVVEEAAPEVAVVEVAQPEPMPVEVEAVAEVVAEYAPEIEAEEHLVITAAIEPAVDSVDVETPEPQVAPVEVVEVVEVADVADVEPTAVHVPEVESAIVEATEVKVAEVEVVAVEVAEPVAVEEPLRTAPVVVAAAEPAVTTNVVENRVVNHQVSTPDVVDNIQATTEQPVAVEVEPATGFRALELREEVQKAIEATGYTTPTDIQSEIIPHVLAGRDVLAQSQTGTGKTAAFALPILSKINVKSRKPQVLVLAPTRELAMQVAASFATYGREIPGFDVAAVYGGQGYDTQLRQLRRGVPVVVGTPGRVIDHIKRRTMDLSELECLVLDEADEMLNMGFLEDVKFVLEQTPKDRQVALFSATLPGPIQKIAQQYLNDPVRITIKRKTMTADAIRQRAVFASPREKLDVLTRFLGVEATDGVIIFTKTREATVTVAEHLVREGYAAVALNGDMPQNVRERTIAHLKSGRLDVLVATDVAARGLDVSRISHVFNYDVPHDTESYVHRIGRTGRAGRKGEAIILLSSSQRYKLRQIERLTKQSIQVVPAPTADDINASRVEQFKKKITEVADSKDLELFTKILTEYATESGKSMEVIAAALAEITQNGRPFLVEDRPRRNRQDGRGERFERDNRDGRERNDRFNGDRREREERPRQPRRSGRVESGMDRYRIEVGHEDGVMPGNIVGAVANEAGIEGEFIGPINIYDNYSTIDLPEGMPREVHDVLQVVRVAGKPLRLRKASESDNHGDSSGGGGGGGGRNFSRGPKRFGGKPRSNAPGGRFDRKKRRPRD